MEKENIYESEVENLEFNSFSLQDFNLAFEFSIDEVIYDK